MNDCIQREKEIHEIHERFKEFQKTIRNTFIGSIGMLVGIGIWVGTIQTKVSSLEKTSEHNGVLIEGVISAGNDLKVSIAKLETHLVNIQITLEEIKKRQ